MFSSTHFLHTVGVPLLLAATACGDGGLFSQKPRPALAENGPSVEKTTVGSSTGPLKRAWAGNGYGIQLSPDGRFFALTGDDANLELVEVATGSTRKLTARLSWNTGYAYAPAFSPDGKRVAATLELFRAGEGGSNQNEITIVSLDGSAEKTLLKSTAKTAWFETQAWSPDGQWLLLLASENGVNQLLLLSADGTGRRQLKSFDWRAPRSARFTPDGNAIVYAFQTSESDANLDLYRLDLKTGNDEQLTRSAEAELLIGVHGDQLYYQTSTNGLARIWSAPLRGGRLGEPVLVRGDLWGVTSVTLGGGNLFVETHNGEQRLNLVALDAESSNAAVTSSPWARLPLGYVLGLAWSPDGEHVAYLHQNRVNGSVQARLTVKSLSTAEEREVPVPPAVYLNNLSWTADGLHFTERRGGRNISIHRVEFSSGKRELLPVATRPPTSAGEIERPPIRSADGMSEFIPKSDPEANRGTIVQRDLKTGEERVLYTGGHISRMAASPDGRFVAFVTFAQQRGPGVPRTLRVLSVGTGESQPVLTAPGFASLHVLGNGDVLYTLPDSADQTRLWRANPKSSSPALVTSLPAGSRYALSPDGRRLVFSSNDAQGQKRPTELWLLEASSAERRQP